MASSPNSHSTARRNLAQRIDRFLRAQAAMPAPTMTGWQADQVFVAIELLGGEHFVDGEHAMMRSEFASVLEPAGYVATARHDVRQLLERLQKVLAG
jgi:hypothetical protein